MIAISIRGLNEEMILRQGADFAKGIGDVVLNSVNPVGTMFRRHEKKLFMTEGGSGAHGKWPELSPKYRAWKEKHFPGRKIMVLRGPLMASLTGRTGDTIQSAFRSGNSYIFKFGTAVESPGGFDYPAYHQERAGKKRRTIDPTEKQANLYVSILRGGLLRLSERNRILFDRASIGPGRIDRWDI